jgi:hypothetical protein
MVNLRVMSTEGPGGMLETLESRILMSGATTAAGLKSDAPAATVIHAHAASASTRNYVVGFFGFGGTSFGNSWLQAAVTAVGGAEGATTRLYEEDAAPTAVTDLFKFIDRNGDHILSAAEIDNVSVDAIGYSFGGIAASEFSRALTATGKHGLYGYRLAAAVPVDMLETIDPVNNQPGHHTDGPLSNVQNFVSYYQQNAGSSSIALTLRGKHRSAGNATFGANATGSALASAAQQTSQTLVDNGGALSHVVVTQAYSHLTYGSLAGSGVNHMTMPWYLYQRVLSDFGI